jgi:chromosome segregation ATPase
LEAALGSVKEGIKIVILEAGALLHLTNDLVVRQETQCAEMDSVMKPRASACAELQIKSKALALQTQTENERVTEALKCAEEEVAQLVQVRDKHHECIEALQTDVKNKDKTVSKLTGELQPSQEEVAQLVHVRDKDQECIEALQTDAVRRYPSWPEGCNRRKMRLWVC